MRAYLELMKSDLRLALRDKTVIFFNYLFPLIFYFIFAEVFKVRESGTISYIVSMVLILGVLGNGLWGAGMRVVIEREHHILRRFKVAPISASPILVASMVTGWLLYLPALVIVLGVSVLVYGMPLPGRPLSLLIVVTFGLIAFRAIGLILASVANSMQEVNILIQLIYMPMLFLTGVLFPLTLLPEWVQVLSQFLPATYLSTALNAVLLDQETAAQNWLALLALAATAALGTFISVKLFRWEKEDQVPMRSKLWVLAVLAPFILLGVFQLENREQVRKARVLQRNLERQETVLIRGARIFVGDGRVIESGSVLVRQGKIARVFEAGEAVPTSPSRTVEAAGKTLLPGLIDAHIHLGGPAGIPDRRSAARASDLGRNLATYLYCGVVAVRSVGDPLSTSLRLRQEVQNGDRLGADLVTCGPMFTAAGGHGTEYFSRLPGMLRANLEAETLRLAATPEEAREQVRKLASEGVDGIKVILEAGHPPMTFKRLDYGIFRAIAGEASRHKLPVAVHTGAVEDIQAALAGGVSSIEHGSSRERIAPDIFAKMAEKKVFYVPTLTVHEIFQAMSRRDFSSMERTLVQQVGVKEMLESTRQALSGKEFGNMTDAVKEFGAEARQTAVENLKLAYSAGVALAAGSDAGNIMVFHGPAIHRELQLWAEAGLPARIALQAATGNAARLLGIADHVGFIKPGYEASLLLVDGNPLKDIATTERISMVLFKGQRLNRGALLDSRGAQR